jgi:hypothetical protein
VIWGGWAEECVEIYHDIGGKLDGAPSVVHGLMSVVAHDEGVVHKGFAAIAAFFLQTQHTCTKALFVVHNEHRAFLLHEKWSNTPVPRRTVYVLQISVERSCEDCKMVSQLGLPNYVKSLMRRPPI